MKRLHRSHFKQSSWLAPTLVFFILLMTAGCGHPSSPIDPVPVEPRTTPTQAPVVDASPTPSPSGSPSPSPAPVGPATKIVLHAAAQVGAGTCNSLSISAQNNQGQASPLARVAKIELEGNAPVSFFTDPRCGGTSEVEFSLPRDLPVIQVGFTSRWAGGLRIRARHIRDLRPLKSASALVHVVPGSATQIVLSGPTSAPEQSCVGPFKVSARDPFGNPAVDTVRVKLSGPFLFFQNESCSSANRLNDLSLSAPHPTAAFYALALKTRNSSSVIQSDAGALRATLSVTHPAFCQNPVFETKNSDLFQLSKGLRATAHGIAFDSRGRPVVVGEALNRKGSFSWVTRRLMENNQWQTVDQVQFEEGQDSSALGIVREIGGGLLVLGSVATSGAVSGADESTYQIMTRRSDSGNPGQWSFTPNLPPRNRVTPELRATRGTAVAMDSFGRPILRGSSLDPTGKISLLLQAGSADGLDWVPVRELPFDEEYTDTDDVLSSGPSSQNFWIDPQGHWWTTTAARKLGQSYRWYVLQSADQGLTWNLLEENGQGYQHPSGGNSIPRTITENRKGALFVGGFAELTDGEHRWIIRSSLDQGQTWQTIDELTSFAHSEALALTTDSTGGVYATGFARASGRAQRAQLIVRYSPSGLPGSFETVYTAPSSIGSSSMGRAIEVGPDGQVVVAGSVLTKKGEAWVITRGSCPPQP